MAVDEVGRRYSFLALDLQFEQLKRGPTATTHQEPAAFDCEFTFFRLTIHWLRCPDVQIFSAKSGVGPGPGLEAAHAVHDFLGSEMKIYPAIFFLKDGRERCLGIVLGPRLN